MVRGLFAEERKMNYLKEVVLCGRPRACCPVARLLLDGVTVEIEDDDGDCVYMTQEQFEILKRTKL